MAAVPVNCQSSDRFPDLDGAPINTSAGDVTYKCDRTSVFVLWVRGMTLTKSRMDLMSDGRT